MTGRSSTSPPGVGCPTDASYGVQKSADPRIADFYCGHQDSYRMIVNLDWGRDLVSGSLRCARAGGLSSAAKWRSMAATCNSTSGTT